MTMMIVIAFFRIQASHFQESVIGNFKKNNELTNPEKVYIQLLEEFIKKDKNILVLSCYTLKRFFFEGKLEVLRSWAQKPQFNNFWI